MPTELAEAETTRKLVDDLERKERDLDRSLKALYAIGLFILLGLQMAVTNLTFMGYANRGVDWKVPAEVMVAFLSATVIEMIAVVTIVTRYLFPPRGPDSGDEQT